MGCSKKPKAKKTDSESDVEDRSKSVVFLSSSDDEEANKDLSMEIVQRAQELKRKRAVEEGTVIAVSSASDEDIQMNVAVEEKKRKRKVKVKEKKKKKNGEEKEAETATETAVDDSVKEEEHAGTTDSVVTEVNDVPDNAVLRKLLRVPRYFDPVDKNSEACFNCGEEGHTAADCTMERRKRPCFVCGMFGHFAKQCTQGQYCFTCKRRGHIAKDCPEKHQRTPPDSIICLRCGNFGHDLLACKNDYALDDLKEIQCYVCKNYGHLCCAEFTDNGPKEVFCYNCAQSGHTGLGCAKPRGEMLDAASSARCYICDEEGHFARGCTKYSKVRPKGKHIKFDQWEDGYSTPQRSVPRDDGNASKKKKKVQDKDRWNMASDKSSVKGGWIVDDSADLPRRKHNSVSWKSSLTPVKKSHKAYSSAYGGRNSASRSPFKKHKSILATPNSNTSTSSHSYGYSASGGQRSTYSSTSGGQDSTRSPYQGYSATRYSRSHDYYEGW